LGVGNRGEGESVSFRYWAGRSRRAGGVVGCGDGVGGLKAGVKGLKEFEGEIGFYIISLACFHLDVESR